VARVIARLEEASSRHTLHALETFAEHLARADLKDHATMILVSGGFSVDPARRYFNIADKYVTRGTHGADNLLGNANRLSGFLFQDEVQQSIGSSTGST